MKAMPEDTDFLDPQKAAAVNTMYTPGGFIPNYVKAGSHVSVEVESREMEKALIRAYDYGIDALSAEGQQLVQRFVDDAVLRMSGKIK